MYDISLSFTPMYIKTIAGPFGDLSKTTHLSPRKKELLNLPFAGSGATNIKLCSLKVPEELSRKQISIGSGIEASFNSARLNHLCAREELNLHPVAGTGT